MRPPASVGPLLVLDVLANDGQWCAAARGGEVGGGPEVVAVGSHVVVLPQISGRNPFEAVHQFRHRHFRWVLDEEVHVVVLAVELDEVCSEVHAHAVDHGSKKVEHVASENVASVLSHKDQVDVHRRNDMPASSVGFLCDHRPNAIMASMKVRYRYRIDPTPGQRVMLARTFGCARVVFNDALRHRDDSHRAGLKVSDTDVQRHVVTEAKRTTEREWLSEVSSVALVQSVGDARVAYRNWFDSMAGKRKGRKVGHPKFKSKRGRQSIRLTRNGFSLRARTDGQSDLLYVAKVGEVRVRWSRPLPSAPSSVTITKDPDGRYHASFVVEVAEVPLPEVERMAGIDLGLIDFATIITTDGEVEKIPALRAFRRRERQLARAQRSMSRKKKGSRNRDKARQRVAVLHRKVKDERANFAHQLASRLIDENQVVIVEDLAVSGLARTRLAKSVHDAAWGQFVRLLEEKASRRGREVVKVSRWFPSTKTCSTCGLVGDSKPLSVREWECKCGDFHDRDVNAAKNILAAGRAERINARGGDVRPQPVEAVSGEAGSHRGVAA